MKTVLSCLVIGVVIGLTVYSHALVDTRDELIVETGEKIELGGTIFRTTRIEVQAEAMIIVPREEKGYLNLIAPQIIINGSIISTASSAYEEGAGQIADVKNNGGGGGGYGGTGGKGDGTYPGLGGDKYDKAFLELLGSIGAYAGIETATAGFGGGAIRLDAIDLSLGRYALLEARGNPQDYVRTGGGSGGCILLNGIRTNLTSGYTIDVRGGPGGGVSGLQKSAGGGGGGRYKRIIYNTFNDGGANFLNDGGLGGGGSAEHGGDGDETSDSAPDPTSPGLISPANGQEVGTTPTFIFKASDPARSQFLKYRLEISLNSSFSPVSITADQLIPDAGWSKPFYASNEEAAYVIQSALTIATPYWWRVFVTNNEGDTWIQSSSSRSFSTTSNSSPAKPILTSPGQNEINVSKLPSFIMHASDPDGDDLTFTLILSKNQELSNPQIFQSSYTGWDQEIYGHQPPIYQGVTATCQILNEGSNLDALDPGADYYWQIRAFDSYQQSNESDVFHFTTVAKPLTPTVTSLPSNNIYTTKTPTLSMVSSSPTNSQLYYKVELSPDYFNTLIVFYSQAGSGWDNNSYGSGTSAHLTIPQSFALGSGQTYVWRATAYDIDNDNWSDDTDAVSFQVITPPLTPELISPDPFYGAPTQQVTFRYKTESESGNTLNGKIELSEDDFNSVMRSYDQTVDQRGWSSASFASNGIMTFTMPENLNLKRGKNYYWRVQAFDGVSWGPLSETRVFHLTDTIDVQALQVVPNPVIKSNNLAIHLRLSADAKVTFKFYNKLGKQVDQLKVQAWGGAAGNVINYDITNYASGTYYYTVKARSDFGSEFVKKHFSVIK